MTSKYDEKLVDELLELLSGPEIAFSATPKYTDGKMERLVSVVAALRPKPPKFYVLPDFEEQLNKQKHLQKREASKPFVVLGGLYLSEQDWINLREATATEKPMVHIPAGKDWDETDLEVLGGLAKRLDFSHIRVGEFLVDAIKSKLESPP